MYRSSRFNRVVIPVMAAAALIYAAYATDVMRPRHMMQAPLEMPPERPFAHAVAAVGMVEPASELIAVAPRVPGWVEAVYVKAGERVKAGEALVMLDGTDQRAELALRQRAVEVARSRLERLKASPRQEDVPVARALVAQAKAKCTEAKNNLAFLERVDDKRAIREEEMSQRREAAAAAEGELAQRQAELDRLLAGAWKEDVAVAEREVAQALAAAGRVEAEIERLTTRAPIDGVVLRVNARAGQYANTGGAEEAILVMGSPPPWHVRVDINEEDAEAVRSAGARGAWADGREAVAMVRGAAGVKIPLQFVRWEPQMVPKRALSGFATERVDTRVLQAIYRMPEGAAVAVGQQVDVYVDVAGEGRDGGVGGS